MARVKSAINEPILNNHRAVYSFKPQFKHTQLHIYREIGNLRLRRSQFELSAYTTLITRRHVPISHQLKRGHHTFRLQLLRDQRIVYKNGFVFRSQTIKIIGL
jgi:hypothetical protein